MANDREIARVYGPDYQLLEEQDPEIASILRAEVKRQQSDVQLIASENFTSRAVLAALGTVLSNKYAEGYPGKRYYGGCEVVDRAEIIAIERAKQLFGAEHANVQHIPVQAQILQSTQRLLNLVTRSWQCCYHMVAI